MKGITMFSQKLRSIVYLYMLFALLLVFLLPVSASANSQDILSINQAPMPTGVEVRDGRLVFASMDAFKIFMDSIVNQDGTVLDKIEGTLGFLSMRRNAYQQEPPADQKGSDIDEDYWMPISDPYFATALNPEGLIQIGKDVYKVTADHVYKGNEADATLLLTAKAHLELATLLPNLESFDVQSYNASLFQFGNNCYSTNGEYRLKGRSWVSNWFIYSSAGAESEFQQQKKFLWWRWWRPTKAQSLSLESRYDLTVSGQPLAGTYSNTLTNADNVRKVHAWAAGIGPSVFINGVVSSSHKATNNNVAFACTTTDSW